MNTLPKVIVTDFINEPLQCERSILNGAAEVSALNALTESDLDGRIEDADAIMIYHYLRLDGERIRRLRNCRIIVRPGEIGRAHV